MKMLQRFFVLFLLLIFAINTAEAENHYEIKNFPLERNGIHLHLERITLTNNKPTKDILLIHGLTYSSHEFDVAYKDYSLTRFLARNDYNVWLLDITGYGQSDPIENGFIVDSNYAAEDIHAAVKFISDQSGQRKIDILGWSWGTVTTSKFTAKHPEMIHKLILYAPIFSGLGEGKVTESHHKNTWKNAAEDFQTNNVGEIDFAVVEPATAAMFLSNCWRYDKDSSPNGGRRDLLVSEDKRLIFLESLKVPTMIIEGSKDPYINRQQLKTAIEQHSNDFEFIEIEGGSHIMMLETLYYKTFQNEVIKFLND